VDFYSSVAPGLVIVFAIFVSLLCFRRIRMLSARPYARWRRICERIALSVAIVVFLAAGASTLFNALAIHHYRAIYPPQGKLYTVDGSKMHLYCTGEGSPTIILDAGLGNDSLIWANVQPTLSKTTRVCSYDRAGFGWSDLQPRPRVPCCAVHRAGARGRRPPDYRSIAHAFGPGQWRVLEHHVCW
jgi:hypothetical protein